MEQHQPFFSIIVPTFDRPQKLTICLQALAQINYPCDHFEVIVVDDGGKLPLETVIAPFQGQINVTLISQPHAGPATARNTGAARTMGKFLVFTDDDCLPAPDWLQTLIVRFATAPDCIVGGRTLNALPNNLYSTASQLLIDYLYSYYNVDPEQARFFASNNFALPTASFHKIGGFDTTFPLAAGEDREFCNRWLHHDYRMIYAPEVLVYHAHELTLCNFWRQQFNYGRGAFYFHRVCSRRDLEHNRLEPLLFYFNLLIYSLWQTSRYPVLVQAALFVVSQVANAAGVLWERMQWKESELRNV